MSRGAGAGGDRDPSAAHSPMIEGSACSFTARKVRLRNDPVAANSRGSWLKLHLATSKNLAGGREDVGHQLSNEGDVCWTLPENVTTEILTVCPLNRGFLSTLECFDSQYIIIYRGHAQQPAHQCLINEHLITWPTVLLSLFSFDTSNVSICV